jgi:hypothetical protein
MGLPEDDFARTAHSFAGIGLSLSTHLLGLYGNEFETIWAVEGRVDGVETIGALSSVGKVGN